MGDRPATRAHASEVLAPATPRRAGGMTARTHPAGHPGMIAIRPATNADLPACERIWRDGINDYIRKLNQPEVPDDNPGLRRLHAHTLATDPGRFVVAEQEGEVVAFGSAVVRGPVWFLSMLFVDPGAQGSGLGRRILGEIMPARGSSPPIFATTTDSAQPISNGLYGSLGIVPQMPLLDVVGHPRAGWGPPPLPGGITVVPLDGNDLATEIAELDELDRAILGFDHPQDHAYAGRERPAAFAYRDARGTLLGYGYTSAVGRLGPIAVRDRDLLPAVIGHLLISVPPRGASAVFMPGATGPALAMLLEAGFRFEDLPLLLCWNRPFADFERYVPISPGLL
jgi:GNAT superfamily N-acetyltransferase